MTKSIPKDVKMSTSAWKLACRKSGQRPVRWRTPARRFPTPGDGSGISLTSLGAVR
jgi:hypothetical protein